MKTKKQIPEWVSAFLVRRKGSFAFSSRREENDCVAAIELAASGAHPRRI